MNSTQSSIINQGINQKIDFLILVSSDEHEYFLDKKIAGLCEIFSSRIKLMDFSGPKQPKLTLETIRGEILEIIVQYLHFKARYMNTDFKKSLPPFYIRPEIALEVLNASILLKI